MRHDGRTRGGPPRRERRPDRSYRPRDGRGRRHRPGLRLRLPAPRSWWSTATSRRPSWWRRGRRPGRGGGPRRSGGGGRPRRRRRHRGQQRRTATRGAAPGLSGRAFRVHPAGDGGGAVPADPAGVAAHVRPWLGPDREHLLGARAARLAVQGGVRLGEARAGRAVEGGGAGGRGTRGDGELHQPGVRAYRAGGEPDRRPVDRPRHPRVRGDRKDHVGPRGGQAADRAGGGGGADGVPLRAAGAFLTGASIALDGGWTAN